LPAIGEQVGDAVDIGQQLGIGSHSRSVPGVA
jgi:hypothetical protein